MTHFTLQGTDKFPMKRDTEFGMKQEFPPTV